MANVQKVNNIAPDGEGNVNTISDVRQDRNETDKSKSCKAFTEAIGILTAAMVQKATKTQVNVIEECIAALKGISKWKDPAPITLKGAKEAIDINNKKPDLTKVQEEIDTRTEGKFAGKDVVQEKLVQGENIKLVKKPDNSVEISSTGEGGGFWHEDETTKDVTCDEDVTIGKDLSIEGKVQFGKTFTMDVSKVNHDNNIAKFNPDTKQVDFVPHNKVKYLQNIPLKQMGLYLATYNTHGKDSIQMGAGKGEYTYSMVNAEILMPPRVEYIAITYNYTIKGFGWTGNSKYKPLPGMTIQANIELPGSADKSTENVTICEGDKTWTDNAWHRGSRTTKYYVKDLNLDQENFEHLTFTLTGSDIQEDEDNLWELTGCSVEFGIKDQ